MRHSLTLLALPLALIAPAHAGLADPISVARAKRDAPPSRKGERLILEATAAEQVIGQFLDGGQQGGR